MRFVILFHRLPDRSDQSDHIDLMLESADHLRTWRLSHWPAPSVAIVAEEIQPHRKAYLHREGPVTGSRGDVVQFDTGDFQWVHESGEHIVAQLDGRRFTGTVTMSAQDPARIPTPDHPKLWKCVFENAIPS